MLLKKNNKIKRIKLNLIHHQKICYYKRSDSTLYQEKIPGYKAMWFLYYNLFGKQLLMTVVARKLTQVLYGKLMDTKWSKKMIKTFINDFNIPMDSYEKSVLQFKSFNDFFIRKKTTIELFLKFNENILCSPCDGKVLVYPSIKQIEHFYIKNHEFSFKKLINDDPNLNEFHNGSIAIIRLCPSDYHRFHFPCKGFVEKTIDISGLYYSVSPVALRKRASIFWENKRTLTKIKESPFSDYLYIEVGATCVGTIEQTYKPFSYIKRGDEKGYFKFGGSTVILIFKENTVIFDQDFIDNTIQGYETEIKVGEQIGILKK